MPFDPQEARRRVREKKYWNRADEDAAVREVDQAVFKRVADHERGLLDDSQEHMKHGDRLTRFADEIADSLIDDIRLPIQNGVPLSELAQPYKTAVANVHKMISDLERAADQAEFWANRLDDPLADATKLWERLPAIGAKVRI